MSKAHDRAGSSASAAGGAGDVSPPFADELSLLSHDLRSALADILGGLGLIDDQLLPPAERLQLQRARAAAKSLVPLVDSCLGIHGVGRREGERPAAGTNLDQFLREIAARWQGRASEKGLGFRLERGGDLPPVIHCDREALDRILGNFLSNAIKHAGRGEIVLGVERAEGRHLRFTVADNGPGLSPEARKLLFAYRGRPADSPRPGEGLGLFIAHELARQIGGTVAVENRPEGGVVARLTLPLDRPRENTTEGRRAAFTALPDLSGLEVLVAEDNATNQIVVTQMLETLGAVPSLAADGIEALELVRRQGFDFALLDIEMPRMSGLELIRTIRQMTGPAAKMPLIAFTAYVMPEHRERILKAGADGIIAKPLTSIAEFATAIERHLAGRRRSARGPARAAGTNGGSALPRAGDKSPHAPSAGDGGARAPLPAPPHAASPSGSSPGAAPAAGPAPANMPAPSLPASEAGTRVSGAGEARADKSATTAAPRRDTGMPAESDGDAPSAPAGAGPVDRGTFEMLLRSVGTETIPVLLDKLAEDLAGSHEALEAAVAAADPRAVREQTHILMSLAGAVGARSLQACSRELNAAAHRQDTAAMRRSGEALLTQLHELRTFIDGAKAEYGG